MSEQNTPNPLDPLPVTVPSTAAPAAAEESADQLDAANASLARALAVSFTVLRWVMVLLIAIFLASGFFTVAPDEVAVRTRFGQIIPGPEGEVLYPEGGPYFRWPAPVGQVYRIPTVPRLLRIDESFVFRAARGRQSTRPLIELSQGPRLDPEYDGALLTGDQSIVHARYEVSYQVRPEDAARFVRKVASVADLDNADVSRNVVFRLADRLVRNAVEQAVVEDVAGTPLDRFLQGGRSQPVAPEAEQQQPADAMPPPQPSEADDASLSTPEDVQPPQQPNSTEAGADATDESERLVDDEAQPAQEGAAAGTGIEDRVRVRAQQELDQLGCGITLVTVTRTEQVVVSSVAQVMNDVQLEINRAQNRRNDAARGRNIRLISAAGPAWEAVLAVIDYYEEAVRIGETEPENLARATQAMQATFAGEPLGPVLRSLAGSLPAESAQHTRLEALAQRHANGRLGGEAASLIGNAANESSSYVAALEAEALNFERMLATYQERPDLVRRRLLTTTLGKIFSNPEADTTFLAPGSDLSLQISRDRQAELQRETRDRAERLSEARRLGSAAAVAPASQPPTERAAPAEDHPDDH